MLSEIYIIFQCMSMLSHQNSLNLHTYKKLPGTFSWFQGGGLALILLVDRGLVNELDVAIHALGQFGEGPVVLAGVDHISESVN